VFVHITLPLPEKKVLLEKERKGERKREREKERKREPLKNISIIRCH
jgi:hypothetical protein